VSQVELKQMTLRTLAKPESGQADYHDTRCPGLWLRVFDNDRRVFMAKIRVADGTGGWKPKKTRLGDATGPQAINLADARELKAEYVRLAKAGIDPTTKGRRRVASTDAEQRKADADTAAANSFGVHTAAFLVERETILGIRESTLAGYKAAFNGGLVADWKDRPLREISRSDVEAAIDHHRKAKRPVAANRQLGYLRAFFTWALEKELVDRAPTNGLKKSKEKPRQIALQAGEIRELWQTLDAYESHFSTVAKLLLLTACRRNEIGELRWGEVRDLSGEHPRIEIPADRYKTGSKVDRGHTVWLSGAAVELLKSAQKSKMKGCDYVFSTTGESPISGWEGAKKRIDRMMAAARKENKIEGKLFKWSYHDLRRTVRTRLDDPEMRPFLHAVRAGDTHVPFVIGEAILGKGPGTDAAVYAVNDHREAVRVALEAWSRRVASIVDGEPTEKSADVIQLQAVRHG
jgi:integrase